LGAPRLRFPVPRLEERRTPAQLGAAILLDDTRREHLHDQRRHQSYTHLVDQPDQPY